MVKYNFSPIRVIQLDYNQYPIIDQVQGDVPCPDFSDPMLQETRGPLAFKGMFLLH